MFGAEVTEDGNYVALYTMMDTSRVRNYLSDFHDILLTVLEKSPLDCGPKRKRDRTRYEMEKDLQYLRG
jgi:hypothetical protein